MVVVTLTDQQWDMVFGYLTALGQKDPTTFHGTQALIKDIELANGIKTYVVVAKWLNHAAPHPRDVDNPQLWPPEMTLTITQHDPINTVTIRAEVLKKCSDPIAIYATHDPTGRYGWKKLEDWP